MNDDLKRACIAARRRMPEASTASVLASARAMNAEHTEPLIDFYDGKAEWKQDSFRVVARVKDDDVGGELDFLGKFTDEWTPGAVKRHGEEYKYFVPGYSIEARRADLSKLGYSRHQADTLARKQALEDMRRLDSEGDSWSMTGIVVRVYKQGIELAHDSLWGIESDCGEPYQREVAADLAKTAIEEAQKKLSKLVSGDDSE